MASRKVSVTVKYSKPGTKPPVYLAGSFSDPAWEPQEMHHTIDENGEYEYHKEVEVEESKEYQYKFRIGDGDWWVVNEDSPTGTNLLFPLVYPSRIIVLTTICLQYPTTSVTRTTFLQSQFTNT